MWFLRYASGQTDRHTDTLIAIFRHPTTGEVKITKYWKTEAIITFTEVFETRTNRAEEMFEHGLAHDVADVLLARVFAVLPLLLAAEVKHLGDVVKYKLFHCLPASQRRHSCDQDVSSIEL